MFAERTLFWILMARLRRWPIIPLTLRVCGIISAERTLSWILMARLRRWPIIPLTLRVCGIMIFILMDFCLGYRKTEGYYYSLFRKRGFQ